MKPGKQRLFRDLRNPIVCGGAVDKCIAPNAADINPFDIVAVIDADMQSVGYGFYNEKSMFRVRLLHHGHVQLPWDYAAETSAKLANTFKLRALLGLSSTETNNYICRSLEWFHMFAKCRVMGAAGGGSAAIPKKFSQKLSSPIDVLVSTTGRLLQLIKQRSIDLHYAKQVIINEVDRMFDASFGFWDRTSTSY